MTNEEKEQFKKEKVEEYNKEIAEIELTVSNLEKQRDTELRQLKEKIDILKYQKDLYSNG